MKNTRANLEFDGKIEKNRKRLIDDPNLISTKSRGANSKALNSRKISSIAKHGISSQGTSQVLCSLIEHFQSKRILELGTSLGINALYLASCDTVESVVSVDANDELIKLANTNMKEFKTEKVTLECEDVDFFLDKIIGEGKRYDFVFIDANHTRAATLTYFDKVSQILSKEAIVVLDDINWSVEMSDAWREIKSKHTDQLTVENYQLGIVFSTSFPAKGSCILDF